MKKVKIFLLGMGLVGLSALGISYFGATEAEAQGSFQCQWNGEDCKTKGNKNMCGCEESSGTPVLF